MRAPKKLLFTFFAIVFFISCLAYVYVHATYSATSRLQTLINPPSDGQPNQWLGADAATSIKISDQRYVWLFGDTILGVSNFPKRAPYPAIQGGFIHNSVGVANYEKGHWLPIQKYFRQGYKAIFSPVDSNYYYWVLAGAMVKGNLFLVACRLHEPTRIVATHRSLQNSQVIQKKPQSMGIVGTTFLLVDNPQSPPDQWQVAKTWDVPGTNALLNWYSAVVKTHNYLYIVGERGQGLAAHTILSRMTLADAADGDWQQRKYYIGKHQWSQQSAAVSISGLPGTSEMSIIRRHNKWYTLQVTWNAVKNNPRFIRYSITPYTATQLIGPWTRRPDLYTPPAPWNTAMVDGVNTYSVYAPKLHPELAQHGELVFTYNTNVNGLGLNPQQANTIFYHKIRTLRGLYIPQFFIMHPLM